MQAQPPLGLRCAHAAPPQAPLANALLSTPQIHRSSCQKEIADEYAHEHHSLFLEGIPE